MQSDASAPQIIEFVPRFFWSLTISRNIWIAILLAIWGAGMAGVPLFVFVKNNTNHELFITIIKIVPVAIIITVLLLTSLIARRAHNMTTYRITDGRLEYSEGYIFIEDNSILIDEISGASLKKGFLQKKYNLGSILLQSSSGEIKLADIPNPERALRLINEVTKKQT